ncbi:hypothetical protein BM526_20435 (plasmid) [Alteromonas mediterranea]|uniref:hypothetical protein n=1 Tax=Alteromonas mediterranea TaxID=314275 RepID=UPI000903CDB9|nr:hypothetical protein [Alteromonas mediterranea]APE04342.1 hypothetical protein BM526_20435 [Alteromonas mediterranea]
MRSLSDYSDGLKRLLLSLESPEKDYQVNDSKLLVVRNVHDALLREGYPVSMSQAEEIWSAYSFNKYASWMVGGETVEDALSAVIELCDDIENGENHIGL